MVLVVVVVVVVQTHDSEVRRKGASNLSTKASGASGNEDNFVSSHCSFAAESKNGSGIWREGRGPSWVLSRAWLGWWGWMRGAPATQW